MMFNMSHLLFINPTIHTDTSGRSARIIISGLAHTRLSQQWRRWVRARPISWPQSTGTRGWACAPGTPDGPAAVWNTLSFKLWWWWWWWWSDDDDDDNDNDDDDDDHGDGDGDDDDDDDDNYDDDNDDNNDDKRKDEM